MKILLIDDHGPEKSVILSGALELEGIEHAIDLALDGNQGLEMYDKRGPYDLVLTDHHR
jgi:CheY-like chemotaxis protein